jgi:hypothetical protein
VPVLAATEESVAAEESVEVELPLDPFELEAIAHPAPPRQAAAVSVAIVRLVVSSIREVLSPMTWSWDQLRPLCWGPRRRDLKIA